MKKFLLGAAISCAFISTQASAGVSSYSVDGKALSIDRIGFYLDPSLSEALAAVGSPGTELEFAL